MPGERRRGRTNEELAAENKEACPRCGNIFHIKGLERHRKACELDAQCLREVREISKRVASPEPLFAEPVSKRPAVDQSPDYSSQIYHSYSTEFHPDPDPTTSVEELGLNGSLGETEQAGQSESAEPNADIPPAPESGTGLESGVLLIVQEPYGDAHSDSYGLFQPAPLEEGSIRVTHPYRPRRLYKREVIISSEQYSSNASPIISTGAPWQPFRTREDFEFAQLTLNMPGPDVERHLRLHHVEPNSRITFKNQKEHRVFEDRAAQLLADFNPISFEVDYKPVNGKRQTLEFQSWVKPLREWLLELVQDESVQEQLQFDAEQLHRWSNGAWTRFVTEPWTGPGWEEAQASRDMYYYASLPDDGLPLMIELYADKSSVSSFGGKSMYPVTARLLNLPRAVRNGNGVGGGQIIALLPIVEGSQAETGTTPFANLKCAVWHKAMGAVLESIQSASRLGHAVKLTLAKQLGLDGLVWMLFPTVLAVSADYEEQIIMATHRGLKSLKPCVRCDTPEDELHNLAYEFTLRDPNIAADLIQQASSMSATRAEKFLRALSYRPVNVVLHGALALDESLLILIKLIRIQAELRIVASLEVQTPETIALGRELINQFDLASKECTEALGKNFDFPKMHLLVHLFDDIWNKGASPNFSTKPSESLHRILKKAYEVSSKKNETVDAEVLRKTHLLAVYDLLRAQIEHADKSSKPEDLEFSEDEQIDHIILGSKPRRFELLSLIADAHYGNASCENLARQVQECLDELGLEVRSVASEIEFDTLNRHANATC
ncbi:hypothetical protein FRC07_004449 [Ceratobasidium sp. 392]|nr:hypothetical protein FRC07_004449 [Ceratobasidium sp. 392]